MRQAVEEEYDFALELPIDFVAENTDLMFFHALKKFRAFREFDPYTPVPYPDWDKPVTRVFKEGKITGIYTGCPVGPYRSSVAEAVADSISKVLENSK